HRQDPDALRPVAARRHPRRRGHGMSDFDELAGGPDLSTEERARLRRVHDLLVEAGPPPDLTPALEQPAPTARGADVIQFPLPRRRLAATLIAAAAIVIAGFGAGFLFGHSKAKTSEFAARHVLEMHGLNPDQFAVLRLGKRDKAGNWPMEMKVTGL